MILALAMMMAPVAVPSGDGKSVEEKVAILADAEVASRNRYEWAIYDDPAMRSELRRVGFGHGCAAVAASSAEMVDRHAGRLRPYAEQAIRTIIPERRLAEARFISFIAHPFTMYSGRVHAEVDRLAASEVASARDEMRQTFLNLTKPMLDTKEIPEETVKPKADISAALGLNGRWDFNNPAQIAMACLELRMDPRVRPMITQAEPVETIVLKVEPPTGAKPE